MEKAGNGIENGTLEHFTHYKYAPTRSTPLSLFALTDGTGGTNGLIASSQRHNNENLLHNGVTFLYHNHHHQKISSNNNNIIGNNMVNGNSNNNTKRQTYSTESEMTSMTSLSNNSVHTTLPNHDTTKLPQAEE